MTKVYQRMMELTAALIGSPDADSASLLDDARAGRAYDEVKRFLYKFYDNAPQSRLVEILTEMLLALSPSGIVTPSGVRLANVSPDALRYAIVETTEHPPRVFASAWPFAMRKLESGKGNLALGGDGLTGTERASRRHHAEDARIAPEVKRLVDSVGGSIGRRPVTTKADEQRTALRWMAGSAAVRSELAEACEATFRGWRQDIPGLDVAKENWVRAEALKRWRAAGRPLPMPPVRHQ